MVETIHSCTVDLMKRVIVVSTSLGLKKVTDKGIYFTDTNTKLRLEYP